MRAGSLRHRVTIQRIVISRDSFGGNVEGWESFAEDVPASIDPISSKDIFVAQQTNSELTTKITIRYLAGVTSKMRVVCGDRVFDIVSPPINYLEKNRQLQLLCAERS